MVNKRHLLSFPLRNNETQSLWVVFTVKRLFQLKNNLGVPFAHRG